jgi:hypothetical protein
MGFSSWLRNWTANRGPQARSQRRPAARGFRPQLEALEDRCLPSTLTVTNNLDNGSVGSLRYEIGQSRKGDTIVFAPSLKGQTITLSGSELDITKSLTIQGPGAGLLTINGGADGIDNNVGARVFAVENKTNVTLSGLTITGGVGRSGLPYFFAVSAYDNEGGGILNLGTLTVSGCTISGNYENPATGATCYGGGIYNGGTLTVTGSTVSGNSVKPQANGGSPGYGGGIYNAGTLMVTSSTISSNFASNEGGGIYNAGTATVSGCTLSNNSASLGGAIYNAATLTVSNCVFSGNHSYTSIAYSFSLNNIYGPYTDGGGNTFS